MKRRDALLMLAPFLVIGLGARIAANREAQRNKAEVGQKRFLNYRFRTLAQKNGGVVLMATTDFFPSFNFHQTRTLSVGSKFEFHDRHWDGKYEIQAVEPDGVIIAFNTSSAWQSGRTAGTVKLKWK